MHNPVFDIRLVGRFLQFSPIVDEINQCLRFDSASRLIIDVVSSKLDCPLSNSSSCLTIANNISQWRRTDDSDGVLLEIMLQFANRHENTENQLLPLRVSLLGICQDFADIINRPLNRVLLSFLLAFDNHDCADHT